MTRAGYLTLRDHAQALRREELRRIGGAAAVKWPTLLTKPRKSCPAPVPKPHPESPVTPSA